MPTLHFAATTVAPSLPIEALPNGQYLVEITGSEMKPNKSGDGSHLALEFTVLEGEFRNRQRAVASHMAAPSVSPAVVARLTFYGVLSLSIQRPTGAAITFRAAAQLRWSGTLLKPDTTNTFWNGAARNMTVGHAKNLKHGGTPALPIRRPPPPPTLFASPNMAVFPSQPV